MSDDDDGEQHFNLDDDGSNDGDNEQTVIFKRNDLSMANAGRRSKRLRNQTTSKKKRRIDDSEDEEEAEALSAGEMDDIEDDQGSNSKGEEISLEKVFDKHSELIRAGYRDQLEKENFEKMLFHLDCEMSLLVYGVGSKRDILQTFMRDYVLNEYGGILVRGYHSGLTPKTILNDIVDYIKEDIDKKKKGSQVARKWTSTTEIIEFIKRKFLLSSTKEDGQAEPLVLMIHSMDMGVLKGQEWQEMLGELATFPMLRFIISVDNIKSGVLFTDALLDQYNFVCVPLHTFMPFEDELEWQPDTYSAKNDN